MVVSHPCLVPRRASRGLDPAKQSAALQRVQRVVDGLQGHLSDPSADTAVDGLHIEVVALTHGLQNRQAGGRHPEPGLSESVGVLHTSTLAANLNSSSKGNNQVFDALNVGVSRS